MRREGGGQHVGWAETREMTGKITTKTRGGGENIKSQG